MEAGQRVGIIADAHDNEQNLRAFADRARVEGFAEVWLAGDIGAAASYEFLAKHLACRLRAIPGNVEADHDPATIVALEERYPQLTFSPHPHLDFVFLGYSIRLQHEFFAKAVFSWMQSSAPTFLIFGHTHRPELRHQASTYCINPGTLAGSGARATFATIDFSARPAPVPYWVRLHHLFTYT